MFVGEIGIPRREFLYDIKFWEMRRILRGYRNRYRDMWSATRWQAYCIMSSMTDLSKAGIHSPSDLIKFPWDNISNDDIPNDDEIEEMKDLMRKMNAEKNGE